jgi:anti-sigma factor RsiW
MSRRLGHPDPEALACFRAGMLCERRSRRMSAHVARCPRCAVMCARLDAVVAALATASPPVLPTAAERQVISAIDGESGTRASGVPASPRPGALRPGALPPTARPTGSRVNATAAGRPPTAIAGRIPATGSHARRWARSWGARAGVTASLVAAFAGLGYLVRGASTGSLAQTVSSSSPRTAPAAIPGSLPPEGAARTTAFLVTDTGTKYRRSTLRAQVRDRLAAQAPPLAVEPVQPVLTPAPSAAGGALPPQGSVSGSNPQLVSPPASIEVAPPKSLIGCVLHLTGNVPPEFVDRGTYQARPAYVFADAVEAWVVGIDCTAARPALITAVRLGNAH